jgi:hypothetical protein
MMEIRNGMRVKLLLSDAVCWLLISKSMRNVKAYDSTHKTSRHRNIFQHSKSASRTNRKFYDPINLVLAQKLSRILIQFWDILRRFMRVWMPFVIRRNSNRKGKKFRFILSFSLQNVIPVQFWIRAINYFLQLMSYSVLRCRHFLRLFKMSLKLNYKFVKHAKWLRFHYASTRVIKNNFPLQFKFKFSWAFIILFTSVNNTVKNFCIKAPWNYHM